MITYIGVGVVIFTNLILVPVTLSYIGMRQSVAIRSIVEEEGGRKEMGCHGHYSVDPPIGG